MTDRKPARSPARPRPGVVTPFPRAGIKDDQQSLPIALLKAREAVMQYFRPLHRRGRITEQQWRVIRVLHFVGELDAAELARRSFLLAPSLSRILRTLEAQGLITRRPGDTDSRQSLLSLSIKGTATVSGAAPRLDRVHRDIARRFGADRLAQILTLLTELERALADSPVEGGATRKSTGRRRE